MPISRPRDINRPFGLLEQWSRMRSRSRTTATIGADNGYAARRRLVEQNDGFDRAPGPGPAVEVEPMARWQSTARQVTPASAATSVWARACGCAHC